MASDAKVRSHPPPPPPTKETETSSSPKAGISSLQVKERGTLWLESHKIQFRVTPVDGAVNLLMELDEFNAIPREDRDILRKAFFSIRNVLESGTIGEQRRAQLERCLKLLNALPLDSNDGVVALATAEMERTKQMLALCDISVSTPPLSQLALYGITDPIMQKRTSEMRVLFPLADLSSLARDEMRVFYTRPRALYATAASRWFNPQLLLRIGSTPLALAFTEAVRRAERDDAFEVIFSQPLLTEALTKNVSISSDELRDVTRRARKQTIIADVLRWSVAKTRESGQMDIGKPMFFIGSDEMPIRAFPENAIKGQMQVIELALARVKSIKETSPLEGPEERNGKRPVARLSRNLAALSPDAKELNDVSNSMSEMLKSIIRMSSTHRVTLLEFVAPTTTHGKKGQNEANSSWSNQRDFKSSEGAQQKKRMLLDGSGMDSVWSPPDLKTLAPKTAESGGASSAASRPVTRVMFIPLSGNPVAGKPWYVLEEQALLDDSWRQFLMLSQLGAQPRTEARKAKIVDSTFARLVSQYQKRAELGAHKVRLADLFSSGFSRNLTEYGPSSLEKRVTGAIHVNIEARPPHNAMDSPYTVYHARSVRDQLQIAATMHEYVSTSAKKNMEILIKQIDSLIDATTTTTATKHLTGKMSSSSANNNNPSRLTLSSSVEELRTHGYEALCTVLSAFKTFFDAPLARSVDRAASAHRKIEYDSVANTPLLQSVRANIAFSTLSNAIVDRCVLYLSHRLDKFDLSGEEVKYIRTNIVDVWVKRLNSAAATQAKWGGVTQQLLDVFIKDESTRALFSIPRTIVCQSVAGTNDRVCDGLELLSRSLQVSYEERSDTASRIIAESACLQAVLWDAMHIVNVLYVRDILDSSLLRRNSSPENFVAISDYIREEITAAQSTVAMIVMEEAAPDSVTPDATAEDILKAAGAVGRVPTVKPQTRIVHTRRIIERAEEALTSSGKHYSVCGMFVHAFISGVQGLSRNKTKTSGIHSFGNKRDEANATQNTITVPRLVECMSIFNFTTRSMFWKEESGGSLAPREPFAEIVKHINTDFAQARATLLPQQSKPAWYAHAARLLKSGDVDRLGRMFTPPLHNLDKAGVLEIAADTNCRFLVSSRGRHETALERIEKEAKQLDFAAVRGVIPPISSLPVSYRPLVSVASGLAASAAAAAAGSGQGEIIKKAVPVRPIVHATATVPAPAADAAAAAAANAQPTVAAATSL